MSTNCVYFSDKLDTIYAHRPATTHCNTLQHNVWHMSHKSPSPHSWRASRELGTYADIFSSFTGIYSSFACIYSSFADIYSSFAGIYSSFADIYSSFAGIYSSFAHIYSSFADIYSSFADSQGPVVKISGSFANTSRGSGKITIIRL